MKRSGIPELIGKRIVNVVVAKAGGSKTIGDQVFFVFDDQTWFEFYGTINLVSGISDGGLAATTRYAYLCSAEEVAVYGALPMVVGAGGATP